MVFEGRIFLFKLLLKTSKMSLVHEWDGASEVKSSGSNSPGGKREVKFYIKVISIEKSTMVLVTQ